MWREKGARLRILETRLASQQSEPTRQFAIRIWTRSSASRPCSIFIPALRNLCSHAINEIHELTMAMHPRSPTPSAAPRPAQEDVPVIRRDEEAGQSVHLVRSVWDGSDADGLSPRTTHVQRQAMGDGRWAMAKRHVTNDEVFSWKPTHAPAGSRAEEADCAVCSGLLQGGPKGLSHCPGSIRIGKGGEDRC